MNPDWVDVLETWSTIVANFATILGVPIAISIVVQIAITIRRSSPSALEIRHNQKTGKKISEPFENIWLETPIGGQIGNWRIHWSDDKGGMFSSAAKIKSPLLKLAIASNPSEFEGQIIVGDLEYTVVGGEGSGGFENVAVTAYRIRDRHFWPNVLDPLRTTIWAILNGNRFSR